MPTGTHTPSANARPSGEQRRLSTSYGFQVAKRFEAAMSSPDRQLRKDARDCAHTTPPGLEKGKLKKKKKINPYAGPSGQFSKKPRWTKGRRVTPRFEAPTTTIDVAPSAVSVAM